MANLLRLLTLPEDVIDMVRRNVLSAGHARVLAGLDSDDVKRSLAKKLIEAAGFQAVDEGETRRLRNVSRLGFHAFRHSYVSMLINSGVNPLVVRDLVGHTSVDMTARYTHVALDTKVNAVKNLPILGENRIQNNTFAEVICNLPAEKFPRLASHLEAILTPEQQIELIRYMR